MEIVGESEDGSSADEGVCVSGTLRRPDVGLSGSLAGRAEALPRWHVVAFSRRPFRGLRASVWYS